MCMSFGVNISNALNLLLVLAFRTGFTEPEVCALPEEEKGGQVFTS